MIDKADCRFVSTWLTKAAEAQTFWSQALNEVNFADRVLPLHVGTIPDLAASALEILGETEHWRGVAVFSLYSDDDDVLFHEFGLLMRLGFFVGVGRAYRMAIPEHITLAMVKQAALDLLSIAADDDEGIQVLRPERLMHTISKPEAEAERSIMMALRRFRMIAAQ